MKALRALANRKYKIIYERKRWDKKGKELTDVIITESSLIQIVWGLIGLSVEEKKKWDEGRFSENEFMDRSTIAVEFSPIMVDQIDGYFLLIPSSFYEDIKAQIPAAKYSQYIPLFLEWLILQAEIQRRAKTGWKIIINYKKLADKLGMGVKWNCHFPNKRNLKFPTFGKKIKRVTFETAPFFSSSPDDTMILRL